MSLDKAIASGAEHRKPYYKSARHDRSCRSGGSCGYCRDARTYSARKREAAAKAAQEDDRPK